MAYSTTFGSETLYQPGAYSQTSTDNTDGVVTINTNVMFIVGEASQGAPGDVEGIQSFSTSQLPTLVAKYGSGGIVDCALAAATPSKTPGVGGAGRFLVWKTNSSTQASITIDSATDDLFIIKDRLWGVGGNNLAITVANGSSVRQKVISISKLNSTTETLAENKAQEVLTVIYAGNASAAVMEITGISQTNKVLTTTLTGQSDGSLSLSIPLANYNMKELVDYINAQIGYTAVLTTPALAAKKALELDLISSVSILTTVTLYRLQYELLELLNSSSRVEATLAATPVVGVPVNITSQFLTGGVRGASINSDFSNGFAASLSKNLNVIVPAISQDAAADITLGVTDPSSTYTIASVLAALSSHLGLRGLIKNRKDAQAIAGFRASTKAAVYAQATAVFDAKIQLAMLDLQVVDQTSTLVWKQPHVMAAQFAGIRLGQSVGTPITFKFINASNVGHYVNPETGIATGDINLDIDADDIIIAGVTTVQNENGGWRIVVDNTTYGIDNSFLYNRGSVVQASQYIAKYLRDNLQAAFVGGKVSNGQAGSVKTYTRKLLLELNEPDVNITTASSDAPNGFKEETLAVTQQGNATRVRVHAKPVQGQDFILIDLTVGDITQTA